MRIAQLLLVAVTVTAAACSGAAHSVAPVVPEPTVAEPVRVRHAVRPVVPARAFEGALARGTRTADGRPGPGYWQNRVSYRIDAELDPSTSRVQGELVAVYRNNSPDTLRSVLMHLYQNAYAPGVQRVRRVPVTGGVRLGRVEVDDVAARATQAQTTSRTQPEYRVDGTLMWVDLVRPLLPGGSLELQVGWSFAVPPRGAPRTGHAEKEAYVVAQWYPQVAVYDDVRGWHARPYWTNGEFYLEYGSFDVSLTVPEGWLVTATGALENADEVLPSHVQQRLRRALSQDSIVQVVTVDDIEQGRATAAEPGGQLTWRFRADDVRDFAFATSNRYVWDATRVLPATAERAPIAVHALYRPDARNWSNAARYMRHATSFHIERWGPYIYPHISAAEGPIGGMEYPMLVFIGAPARPVDLYAVLSHEIAHEWWPMMVGSNETLHAWQDEGLVTYVEDLSVRDYFPGETPELSTQDSYLRIAGTDAELPLMTAPDLFGIGPQYGVAAYTKPGTLLRALGGVIGDDVVHTALREYTSRWLLKHPTAYDFFNVVEDVAGADLDWFWSPFFYETATFDQAVTSVGTSLGSATRQVTITVADHGTAPLPVLLRVTTSDGAVRDVRMPVEPWLAGALTQSITLDVTGDVVRVEVDPERRFPDVDRSDNVWTRTEG
ncbi:MAG TPA: M1 family metallopeptidase [Longimicrobiales bacterium]|nr:M1 family metallopeptidase [Longimicrobiales bacterium]